MTGFDEAEMAKVHSRVSSMKVDEEDALTFRGKTIAEEGTLKIGIFMDDIDAPYVSFLEPVGLISLIDVELVELEKFCEDNDM